MPERHIIYVPSKRMRFVLIFVLSALVAADAIIPEKYFSLSSTAIWLVIIIVVLIFLPLLRSAELPWAKLEFKDLVEDFDSKLRDYITKDAAQFGTSERKESASRPEETIYRPRREELAQLSRVAEVDPNLAIAGLRIEAEKALRQIARDFNIPLGDLRGSAGRMAHILMQRGAITRKQYSILSDFLALCNKAVHGYDVTPEDARRVFELGEILLSEYETWRKIRDVQT